jgi:hypothetical protein
VRLLDRLLRVARLSEREYAAHEHLEVAVGEHTADQIELLRARLRLDVQYRNVVFVPDLRSGKLGEPATVSHRRYRFLRVTGPDRIERRVGTSAAREVANRLGHVARGVIDQVLLCDPE